MNLTQNIKCKHSYFPFMQEFEVCYSSSMQDLNFKKYYMLNNDLKSKY
jgi:hypothetical protein